MRDLIAFISNNKIVLIGILLGLILGYIHWYYFACYWGTYPLSSECWVNCSFGAVLGGFMTSLIERR